MDSTEDHIFLEVLSLGGAWAHRQEAHVSSCTEERTGAGWREVVWELTGLAT